MLKNIVEFAMAIFLTFFTFVNVICGIILAAAESTADAIIQTRAFDFVSEYMVFPFILGVLMFLTIAAGAYGAFLPIFILFMLYVVSTTKPINGGLHEPGH